MTERKKEKDLKINKDAVDTIYAETVTCSQAGIKSINAGHAQMDQCGVGYLRAQNVTQTNCGNAVIYTKNLKTDSVKSIVTISENVEGDVTTLLDKKGAAVFGLVFASVMILFRILRRLAR